MTTITIPSYVSTAKSLPNGCVPPGEPCRSNSLGKSLPTRSNIANGTTSSDIANGTKSSIRT